MFMAPPTPSQNRIFILYPCLLNMSILFYTSCKVFYTFSLIVTRKYKKPYTKYKKYRNIQKTMVKYKNAILGWGGVINIRSGHLTQIPYLGYVDFLKTIVFIFLLSLLYLLYIFSIFFYTFLYFLNGFA